MNSIIIGSEVAKTASTISSVIPAASAISSTVSGSSKLSKVAIGGGIVATLAIAGIVGFKVIRSKKSAAEVEVEEPAEKTAAERVDDMIEDQITKINANIAESEADIEVVESKKAEIQAKIEAHKSASNTPVIDVDFEEVEDSDSGDASAKAEAGAQDEEPEDEDDNLTREEEVEHVIDTEKAAEDLKARQDAIAKELESEFKEELAAEGLDINGKDLSDDSGDFPLAEDSQRGRYVEVGPFDRHPWKTYGTRFNARFINELRTDLKMVTFSPEKLEEGGIYEDETEDERALRAARNTIENAGRMILSIRFNAYTSELANLPISLKQTLLKQMDIIYANSEALDTSIRSEVLKLVSIIPEYCYGENNQVMTELVETVRNWTHKVGCKIDYSMPPQKFYDSMRHVVTEGKTKYRGCEKVLVAMPWSGERK